MSLPLILCLLAIVASIVIGYKFKFNTGVIALAFAFIIGNLVMGLKVNDIVAFWPTTIVFYLLSIALFFNYATENGTMDVLGKKLLYAMGGNAKLIPLAIAAVSAIVGGLGAGASTPAIVGPFCFVMALSAGCDPVLTAVAITFGNLLVHVSGHGCRRVHPQQRGGGPAPRAGCPLYRHGGLPAYAAVEQQLVHAAGTPE